MKGLIIFYVFIIITMLWIGNFSFIESFESNDRIHFLVKNHNIDFEIKPKIKNGEIIQLDLKKINKTINNKKVRDAYIIRNDNGERVEDAKTKDILFVKASDINKKTDKLQLLGYSYFIEVDTPFIFSCNELQLKSGEPKLEIYENTVIYLLPYQKNNSLFEIYNSSGDIYNGIYTDKKINENTDKLTLYKLVKNSPVVVGVLYVSSNINLKKIPQKHETITTTTVPTTAVPTTAAPTTAAPTTAAPTTAAPTTAAPTTAAATTRPIPSQTLSKSAILPFSKIDLSIFGL
jgi:hypothetical protein